jgi:hypothetical protein
VSRMALELERQVKEMRAKAAKEQPSDKGRKANKESKVADLGNETSGPENQLTGDSNSGMTDSTNLSGQEDGTGGNDAAEADAKQKERKPTVAKKNGNGAAKKAKTPKAPKAPKAAKPAGERKPREKKVASGKLKKVEASGTTYLTLEFEEGTITLTPTGNREQNRDIAVKALRALL